MALLAVTGLGWAALAIENAHAATRARQTDETTVQASRFFAAVSFWSRDDLDRHLGTRPEGPFLLHVERLAPTLYRVRLVSAAAPTSAVVETVLYRPVARGFDAR